jgi:pimeloyl-ACP methyl ester carboxylesterase
LVAAPAAPLPGLIFVCNGSGGGNQLTNGLVKATAYAGERFCVDTIVWSRFQNSLLDHSDRPGHFAAADQLAGKIQQVRTQQPGRKIYVASFSAGTHVALEAAKRSPPNSIDRIILLGASVAFCYDLGPALRSSCDGIDSFYSYNDGVLETIVAIDKSADGIPGPAAGRIGFWLPSSASPMFPLYQQKLRQYPWQPTVRWTGHCGNHGGWVEYKFLQTYVVPLLRVSEARPVLIAPPVLGANVPRAK